MLLVNLGYIGSLEIESFARHMRPRTRATILERWQLWKLTMDWKMHPIYPCPSYPRFLLLTLAHHMYFVSCMQTKGWDNCSTLWKNSVTLLSIMKRCSSQDYIANCVVNPNSVFLVKRSTRIKIIIHSTEISLVSSVTNSQICFCTRVMLHATTVLTFWHCGHGAASESTQHVFANTWDLSYCVVVIGESILIGTSTNNRFFINWCINENL